MVKQVRGTVRVSSQPGKGTRFQLQLPVTLSVVRTLLVEIGGEPYAFPLASHRPDAQVAARTRSSCSRAGSISTSTAARSAWSRAPGVRRPSEAGAAGDELSVIVVGDQHHAYGLVVDRFLGERELVVQPLDPQLGKVKDIAAGALMEDGSPVLIVDTEDLIRSMDKLVSGGRLSNGAARRGRRRATRRASACSSSTTR